MTTTSQGFLAKSPGANGLGLETNKCTLTCSYHCWISQLMWLTLSIQDARYSNYCKCFVHLVSEEREKKCSYSVVLIQSHIYLQNESNKEAIITKFFVPILQFLLQLHCWILWGLGTDLKVNTNLSLVPSLPVLTVEFVAENHVVWLRGVRVVSPQ